MLNDNRDKELQRNQIIAIVLMTVLVVVWSYFFLPPPQTPPPAPAPGVTPPTEQAPAPPAEAAPVTIAGVELPPVAEAADPALDEVALENEYLQLVLTRVGARLKQAKVILGKAGEDSVQLVPPSEHPDGESVYPLGVQFASDYLGSELDRRRWEVAPASAASTATFSIQVGETLITKTFRLGTAPREVEVDVTVANMGAEPRVFGIDTKEPAFSLVWAPNVQSGDLGKGLQQEVVWRQSGQMQHHQTTDIPAPVEGAPFSDRVSDPEYVAIKSAYFAVALKPEFTPAEGWVLGSEGQPVFSTAVAAPRVVAAPGEQVSRSFKVYLGPTQLAALKQAWPGLDSLLQFFTMFTIMDVFAKFLLSILHWFYSNVYANYGVAIIFLTIVVRTVLFPLTLKSMRSMKKMQKLAPEMEKLKAEVGDDQQELQKRMMALYRERGVNPLGGCLPLLLQTPIFLALYRVYWSAFELRRAPFMFWIKDLSEPDRLYTFSFTIPIPFSSTGINSLNLLPLLMGVAMIMSTELMPSSGAVQNQQQKIIMKVVPIVFSLACYNMASGLNLYILVSTLLGIVQNYFVHVSDVDVQKKVKPSRPASRSKNFYTAALARKRQMTREAKREKRAQANRPDANRPDAKTKEPTRKK
ncbi:MAG: membrane protein insertase YidC [Candidatus Hydrogenedentes bacterium]|nr:membrane protein insertase YidC [Candidatus Hydrogenedentota bacterium]